MKYIVTFLILLTSVSVYARRGNPRTTAASTIDLQYYVVDSDDNFTKKPIYSFQDTIGAGWFRVPALSNNDSGYVRLFPQGTTFSFVHYNKTITLPPRYIHANGFVTYDTVTPNTFRDTVFRIQNGIPNTQLPVLQFGSALPLWCDLELRTTGDSSKIYYKANADTCWVSFYNIFLKGTNGKVRATFQIVYARTDSSITFQYRSFDGSVSGESAANIFQKLATIGVQDSAANAATIYLDRGTYYARSFNGSQYETNLHNGLAVKFIRAVPNIVRVSAITDPPSDHYEHTVSAFTPSIKVENLTSTAKTIYVTNSVSNLVSGIQLYNRTDSIVNAPTGVSSYTGSSQPVFPCGSFRMTTTITTPGVTDFWTFDNVMTRDFVKISPIAFPYTDDFPTFDRCNFHSYGAAFITQEENVERDANAPRSTGAIVLDRADASGNQYRTNSSGDTIITAPMDMSGKSNVWMMFGYQRGLRADSIQAGIRARILSGPEAIDTAFGNITSGDSLLIEGIQSTSTTFNVPSTNWETIAKINGSIDVETKKFRLQIPSAYIHNHSRFRFRLAAKNDGAIYGAPFDDLDNIVIDNLQIVSPVIGSKKETDLEVLGVDLGVKRWTHIPRDAHSIYPQVKIASNGLQVTQGVYQVRLIIKDALSREVYHRTKSLVAPAAHTDVSLTMPEWIIEGSQGGVFTCKISIEQMFSDYHTANDTNIFFRTLFIDDGYGYDDGVPDTVGAMTAAESSWFYHYFTPIKSDSLRAFDFYHLTQNGNTNWTFTFRDLLGNVLFTRTGNYDVQQVGWQRATLTPAVYLTDSKIYEIQCNMTQGFGLGGDASRSLVLKTGTASNLNPIFFPVYDSLLTLFKSSSFGAYYTPSTGATFNGSAGGPPLPMMRLVFGGSSTYLPVELISFTAQRTSRGDVAVRFQTAKEENVHSYDVERLIANEWINASNVSAKNVASGAEYSLVDITAPKTVTTYRLIENDLDGSHHVIASAMVEAIGEDSKTVSLHPNPASHTFTIQLGYHSEPANVSVFNELGMEVIKRESIVSQEIEINTTLLPNGVYYVETVIGEQRMREKLLISK